MRVDQIEWDAGNRYHATLRGGAVEIEHTTITAPEVTDGEQGQPGG